MDALMFAMDASLAYSKKVKAKGYVMTTLLVH